MDEPNTRVVGAALEKVVERHADELSFLWLSRSAAVDAARADLRALERLDERLAAHVDGLRIAGAAGWLAAESRVDEGECGSGFGPMLLALEERNIGRILTLVSIAEQQPPLRKAVLSACGWVSAAVLRGTALDLLRSERAFERTVGIACCALHRVPVDMALSAAMNDAVPELRARALRTAGELGGRHHAGECVAAAGDDDPACRWWAARSTSLLGGGSRALQAVCESEETSADTRRAALIAALLDMSTAEAMGLFRRTVERAASESCVIDAAGVIGDPSNVTWLLEMMSTTETSRRAAEAFALITGFDVDRLGARPDAPTDAGSLPSDNPDDSNVMMDPDDALPWPDQPKVGQWWAANAHRFEKSQRYFMGAPVTWEHCMHVLKHGYQRQRILAAHHLCLLRPGTPLFNTSAPAWRQRALLAKMS